MTTAQPGQEQRMEICPREPTQEMLIAGRKQIFADMTGEHMGPNCERAWKAMFDARPTADFGEELADKIAAAMQQVRDEIGATEQQRISFGYAEAAMRSVLANPVSASS